MSIDIFFYLDPFAVFFSLFEWYLKENVMFDDVKCTIFLITVLVPFCDFIFLFVSRCIGFLKLEEMWLQKIKNRIHLASTNAIK